MRFIETKKLNDYIVASGSFFTDDHGVHLASRVAALESISLQEVSLESDRAFLAEVSSVLNVIASIIYHPHLSNRREEIVLRIELAQQLSREDFWDTARDSKLWKEHNSRMIPEEVYYHQHIDELCIYENRFIGFLIDRIDRELQRYGSFYLQRLPTLSSSREGRLDASAVGELIVTVDRLRRKTQFIKNTFFYREVSKGKPISSKVVPTNILLKDRLYRYCFRFYRALARYEDKSAAQRDLAGYYTVLFLRQLLERGFAVRESRHDRHCLEDADFSLLLCPGKNGTLDVTVTPKRFSAPPSRHLLRFLAEEETGEAEPLPKGYDTYDLLSPWELSTADTRETLLCSTEQELCRKWLDIRLRCVSADPGIYKKYCPVCGSRTIATGSDGMICSCTACHSSYVFSDAPGGAGVWFRRIGKKGIS